MNWLFAYPASEEDEDEKAYSLTEAREKFEVVELVKDSYLVLKWDAEKFNLQFAVLRFKWSEEIDGKEETFLQMVFHGEGPTGNLRECRHTYWGEVGNYIFYPHGPTITAAFRELSKFFDDMA